MRNGIFAVSAIFVASLLSSAAALASDEKEPYTVTCPGSPGVVLRVAETLPTSIEGAEGWWVSATIGESLVSIWQPAEVTLPAFDGVILVCRGRVGNIDVETSMGLPGASCEVDERNRRFLCTGHPRQP